LLTARSTDRSMARGARPRDRRRVSYGFLIVGEGGLGPELRAGIAELLAATLDEGERYRETAWRTLRPAFRVIALTPSGEPVGQGSCFWVPCRPSLRLLGLGDVAVAPEHRRRRVARTICAIATSEGWRLHASAILAKTTPLRAVLADLGYAPATDGRFYWSENGAPRVHPLWMAAIRGELPAAVQLDEGDF
jgi:predicted N-acetyltransferase YhbS